MEVLCCDRWAPYTEAATAAAPQAQQIADRWHLLNNIREALERFLDHHAGRIKAAFTPTIVNPPDSNSETETPAEALSPATAKQKQRHDRWREALRRRDEGQSLRQIAREMQLSWRIVQRYVQSDQLPNWRPSRVKPSQMTNYRERIEASLADGNDNAAALHRQLLCEGVRLSYTTVRTYVSRLMATRGLSRQRINAANPSRSRAPSTKALSCAVIAQPAQRTPTQETQVGCPQELNSEVAEAVELVETFVSLTRKHGGTTWREWQANAWTAHVRSCGDLPKDWNATETRFRPRSTNLGAVDRSKGTSTV
nr:transposase [Thalassoroseus pseudoceratinae]